MIVLGGWGVRKEVPKYIYMICIQPLELGGLFWPRSAGVFGAGDIRINKVCRCYANVKEWLAASAITTYKFTSILHKTRTTFFYWNKTCELLSLKYNIVYLRMMFLFSEFLLFN